MLANPIAAIAMALAAIAVGFAFYFDDAPPWTIVLVVVLMALILTGSMTTRVAEGTVTVTMRPFWRRRQELSAVQSARLIPYVWHKYGGWGIRWGDRAIAYTVWEKQAIRFQLEGRDLVIGTRRPEAFLEALRAHGITAIDTTDNTPA